MEFFLVVHGRTSETVTGIMTNIGLAVPPPDCEVSVVCPVFNEAAIIEEFVAAVAPVLRGIGGTFEIIFVDDGSIDRTWEVICNLSEAVDGVRGIKLSRNYGKEIALTAGLAQARGAAHIPMDVDLQDPVDLIPSLVETWKRGFDQVIPRRTQRQESTFRRLGAALFYSVIGWLTTQLMPREVGDFRLLDAKMTNRFLEFQEVRRVNKVIFGQLGGRQVFIDYARPSGTRRKSGGQSAGKLFDLALAAISVNSARLARLGLIIGTISFLGGLLVAVGIFVTWRLGVIEVPGQATTLMVGAIIVSIQLMTSSFLGIVVAESLRQAQKQPLYFIDEKTSGFVSGR